MIATAMPSANPLAAFLADPMSAEGAPASPASADFAALLAKLDLAPGEAPAVKTAAPGLATSVAALTIPAAFAIPAAMLASPAMAFAAAPTAITAPVQVAAPATEETIEASAGPDGDTDADDDVPEGLESVAATLASALATVMNAARTAIAGAKAPAEQAQPSGASPASQSPLVAISGPIAPKLALDIAAVTPPAIAAAIAAAVAGAETSGDAPSAEASPADVAATGSADAVAPLPELARATPIATAAPAFAAPAFAPVDVSAATQAPTASEIVMNHHLDMAKEGEWLDRLARDIARTAGNESQLRFQLNPEHLGSLRVELSHTADGTAVRISADTEAARNMLVDAQPKLVAEARAQGVRISGTHVDLGQHGGQQRGHEQNPQAFVRTHGASEEQAIRSRPASAAERYA